MRLSILVPFVATRPEQILTFAALVESGRADRLWNGYSALVETAQGFSFAAGAGFRVPLGIGVTLMPLRHPFDAAHQAESLSTTTGHPVSLGIGPGARSFQTSMLGAPYRSPLTAVREYVEIVRDLCAGQFVDRAGEYFSFRGELPRLRGDVEVGIGVLRPGMARLAGEIANRAVTWLTPPRYLQETVVPAVAEGSGGRGAVPVSAFVPVGLHRPGRDPERLAFESARQHLRAPHYVDMLRKAGVDVSGAGGPEDARRLIDSSTFVYGRLGDIAEGLDAYRRAGVSEVVLNLTGTATVHGHQAALDDLKTLLEKLPDFDERPDELLAGAIPHGRAAR